jgi:hypothetical protein
VGTGRVALPANAIFLAVYVWDLPRHQAAWPQRERQRQREQGQEDLEAANGEVKDVFWFRCLHES